MQGTPSEVQQQSSVASSGRPWWKACCVGCLLMMVAIVVGVVIFFRAVSGPQNQRMTQLPVSYPHELIPFRMDAAQVIAYTPGKTRGQMMRIFSAPAKFVASIIPSQNLDADTAKRFQVAMDGYSQQMDGLDTVTIFWKGLDVSKSEVMDYYATLVKQQGMTAQTFHDDASATDILMASRADAGIQVKITDRSDVPGVDTIQVIVDYVNH